MATELENGKEWACRTANDVAAEFGMSGSIEWAPGDEGKLSLMLMSGGSSTEVMSFRQVQLERATYDFSLQYSLGNEIRSAVMEVRLRS